MKFCPVNVSILLIAIVLCVPNAHILGQERFPEALYFPHPLEPGQWEKSAGIILLTIPRDIAEEEINIAPSIDLQSAVGLPWQFSVTGRATVQYVTNRFQAGVRWSQELGPFGISAGYDLAFWFGFLNNSIFDNSMNGWEHYPNLSIGMRIDDVLMTLKGEAIIVTSLKSWAGSNTVAIGKNSLAGGAATFMLEQPFWKNTRVMLGLRLAWTEFYHPTWFAFSTFNRKLLFSELIFGFIL
jgi:hypothetical protein